jgi:hypothetical protein
MEFKMAKTEISNNAAIACNAVLSGIFTKANKAQGTIGATLLRDLTGFFDANPPDLIAAATTPSKVGCKEDKSACVLLSQTRRVYRVYREAPDQYRAIVERGERGWAAIMADVAEVDNALKVDRADAKAIEKAREVAKIAAKDDPAEQARLVEAFAQNRAIEKAEKAAAADREPTAREVAERVVARWIKERGRDFAVDVIDLLPEVFDAVVAKLATAEAVAA